MMKTKLILSLALAVLSPGRGGAFPTGANDSPRRGGEDKSKEEIRLPDEPTNSVVISAQFIDRLLDEARTNNPALRAASARVNAAEASRESVRVWEDPMFKFGGSTASPRGFKESEEGNMIYAAEQKLPLWGKPELARRVAGAAVSTRRAELDYRSQVLRRDLAKGLLDSALSARVVEAGAQDLSWLQSTATAVESKYRSGQASLVELLSIQNEQAKRTDQLRTDRLNLMHQSLGLNRLLNRDLRASWPLLDLPPVAPAISYDEKLVSVALRNEPRIKVMQQEIKQADAMAQMTKRSRLPDLTFGIEGRQYSGDGGFREGMFTVGLNVPLFNRGKYRSDLRRDQQKLQAAEDDRDDQVLSVREELHHLTIAMDAAQRRALLYSEEILPRSEQGLTSALSNWESNRGMFRDVLEARRMLLDAQLMQARAVAEQHQMIADLLLVTGQNDFIILQHSLTEPNQGPGEKGSSPSISPARKP